MVINDAESVKEVLIAKGAHFDGRPDFKRFDILFGGDKQNCKSVFFFSVFLSKAVSSFLINEDLSSKTVVVHVFVKKKHELIKNA